MYASYAGFNGPKTEERPSIFQLQIELYYRLLSLPTYELAKVLQQSFLQTTSPMQRQCVLVELCFLLNRFPVRKTLKSYNSRLYLTNSQYVWLNNFL